MVGLHRTFRLAKDAAFRGNRGQKAPAKHESNLRALELSLSPFPRVADETMREMIPQDSGWWLPRERGHSGSFAPHRVRAHYNKVRLKGKARAFKQNFLKKNLTLLSLYSKHRFW